MLCLFINCLVPIFLIPVFILTWYLFSQAPAYLKLSALIPICLDNRHIAYVPNDNRPNAYIP